jgi:hypothetical protein
LLYKKEGLLWYQFESSHQGRRQRHNQAREFDIVSSTLQEVPTDILCLADVEEDDGRAILYSTCFSSAVSPAKTTTQDISSLTPESIRNEQNKQDKWAIAEWDCKNNTAERLAADIINRTATAVSDGSFKNEN